MALEAARPACRKAADIVPTTVYRLCILVCAGACAEFLRTELFVNPNSSKLRVSRAAVFGVLALLYVHCESGPSMRSM